MSDAQKLINELKSKYPTEIGKNTQIPKPYCPGGVENVKAIYLGCDPTNKHTNNFPFAFAHDSGLKIFDQFISFHTKQLSQIGLDWNSVYTQNLCQNYFTKETSRNKIWKSVAKEWIPILHEELSIFDERIPVLLTSSILFSVLVKPGEYSKVEPLRFYNLEVGIPIPKDHSYLNRDLIPVYRGKNGNLPMSYQLKHPEWFPYRDKIRNYLEEISDSKTVNNCLE